MKGYILTPDAFAKAFRILKDNEDAIFRSLKSTRTSLHPENRHKIDFETAWMESELLAGKVLVVPASIHNRGIEALRDLGVYEEALENIYKSVYLPSQA